VLRNAGSLYGVQAAAYAAPLATLPYLARVLRPASFGQLAFAQSFAACATLLVEYGFVYSATREVAVARGDAAGMERIAASVLSAKMVLLAGLVLLVVGAGLGLQAFRQHAAYLWGAALLAAAQGSSPMWYFQGVERMSAASLRDVLARCAAVAAVFLLVRRPQQGPWVLYLFAAAALASGGYNYAVLYSQVRPRWPSWGGARQALWRGRGMFSFRLLAALYTSANIFFVGLFVPAPAVAEFAGAEKLARAGLGLLSPASQALFPRMSHLMVRDRRRALRAGRASLAVLALGGAILGALLAVTAPIAVRLVLGPGYGDAAPLLRVMALLPPLVAVSNVLGLHWMVPLRMERAFNAIIAAGAAVNLGLGAWLIVRLGPMGMAVATVVAEAVVVSAMLAVLRRRGFDPFAGRVAAGAD
jgi:PST family polysaccharide transporter